MKACGVVLDLNEETKIRIYTEFSTNVGLLVGRICNIRKSINYCFLNIQQVLKDKVPGKFSKLANFTLKHQVRYLQSLVQSTGCGPGNEVSRFKIC